MKYLIIFYVILFALGFYYFLSIEQEPLTCPEQEVITETITEQEIVEVTYEDLSVKEVQERIVEVEVPVIEEKIVEVYIPVECPACICNMRDCPEEASTFLKAKGYSKTELDRAITEQIKRQDPAGNEYLDYLILTRNEYQELLRCK